MGLGETKIESAFEGIVESGSKAVDVVDSVGNAMEILGQKALKGGLTMDIISKSLGETTNATTALVKALGSAGSKLTFGLDLGVISTAANLLSNSFNLLNGSAIAGFDLLKAGTSVVDGFTSYTRGLNAELFKTSAAFNLGYSSVKEYSDYLIKTAEDYASAEFSFISPAERLEAVQTLGSAGIPMKNLTEEVNTAAGSMDLLATSILQAKSLGMDLGSYSEKLSDLMIKQGLSTQEASERMASLGETARKTGLSTKVVSNSLVNFSNQFSKLGLTIDFGTPILESFSKSLTNMGFGFENAIDLSETLSNSLVSLTSNYSAAYLTMQRGGLDFGAGQGALGASIGLRAKLSPTNQNQDQGKLALDLAGAMRDTLASFTSGNIVTVQEAANSPELQSAFLAQTTLLKDLYNISDTGAQDRTLEFLEQLNDATVRGDTEMAESLAKNIQETISGRNDTMAIQEKIAASTEGMFAKLTDINSNLISFAAMFGNDLMSKMIDAPKEAIDQYSESMRNLNNFDPMQLNNIAQEKLDGIVRQSYNATNDIYRDFESFADTIGKNISNAFADGITVKNDTGDALLQELINSIKVLSSKLDISNDNRY